MDRGESLLAALRARAALGGASEVSATEVEALGEVMGVAATELPALVAQLQRRTPPAVELVWGGSLRLLAQNETIAAGAGALFDLKCAKFDHAIIAAGNVADSTVGSDPSPAIGNLAAVIVQLAALRPTLHGDAAIAAARTEELLRTRPETDAPSHIRTNWVTSVRDSLSALLRAAPNAKALVELGGVALKLLNWLP